MYRQCPKCGLLDGIREAIYGLPEFPIDEGQFFIAGCTTEGPVLVCINCGWGQDEIVTRFPSERN